MEESINEAVFDLARKARAAATELSQANRCQKDGLLLTISQLLRDNIADILLANAKDVQREQAAGMSDGLLDRLRLDSARIAAIANSVEQIAALPDPVGQILDGQTLPNGLKVMRRAVPLGVVAMIYEARPNVTVDAAVLCLKSGNAALLRGGSAALESNLALVEVVRQALRQSGFSQDLVASVDTYGRAGGTALMRSRGLVDVLVPRGGAGLIQTVVRQSLVPVIETGVGNCHIFIDKSADLTQARDIVINAKTQRVGVCNAAETLLIHRGISQNALTEVLMPLLQAQVRLHVDEDLLGIIHSQIGSIWQTWVDNKQIIAATTFDWEQEYLSLDLAVALVDDVQDAIAHIRQYSSGHTEAICAWDGRVIEQFIAGVDSAAVAVNASTRFTDGQQLGLGAEIGISTQKLHARGPMGLSALTSSTWIIQGNGHIRH